MKNGDVIIALDFDRAERALKFLDLFGDEKPFVKIGMELFYAEGPQIVRDIKRRGHRVFLDLKLCDIPNTVKNAMAALSKLDVDMVNMHALGSSAMMKAALEGLTRPDGSRPIALAVTVLTSLDGRILNEELRISASVSDAVGIYAHNAKEAGLDGVVCSPLEAAIVKKACGDGFVTVTPGIRFANASADDQKRIATPETARAGGSDYIVVGRPITEAADPVSAYHRCRDAFLMN